MQEHAHAHAHASAAVDAHHAPAAAPGKTTQHERGDGAGAGRYRKGSVFDAFDIGNVNAVEAAAASAPNGTDDDDGVEPLDLETHGGHGHDKDRDKHPAKEGHDRGGGIHIITRAGLRHLRYGGKDGRHAANVLYNNPNAYIVLKEGQTVPKGWKCKPTILFPSYTEFEAAHKAGRIPRFAEAVVYDNEHWAQTPHYEKTNAVHYAKLFGKLAHKLGLVYIAAPTQKWFSADVRFADIIDLQLQGRETHTKAYAKAVQHDAKVAHHLNPDVKVVAQISSNKNHLNPDHSGNIGTGIQKAEHDILDNSEYIDGFWGYLYQQNKKSVKAGQKILTDLADKQEHGHDV